MVKEFAAQKCASHVEDVDDGLVDLAILCVQEHFIAEFPSLSDESVVQWVQTFNPVDVCLVAELSLLIRGI